MRVLPLSPIACAFALGSVACLDFDAFEPQSSSVTTGAGGTHSTSSTGTDGGNDATSGTGGAGGAPASTSTGSMCGNGVVDPGEECDDALSPAGTCTDCSVVCVGDGEHKDAGHCYRVSTTLSNWWSARDACGAWRTGAYIAVVTSQPEQDFVASIVVESSFLGAQLDRGAWTWMNGEPFAFASWENGQGTPGEEDCIAMWVGEPPWYDVECWWDLQHVCEWAP